MNKKVYCKRIHNCNFTTCEGVTKACTVVLSGSTEGQTINWLIQMRTNAKQTNRQQ